MFLALAERVSNIREGVVQRLSHLETCGDTSSPSAGLRPCRRHEAEPLRCGRSSADRLLQARRNSAQGNNILQRDLGFVRAHGFCREFPASDGHGRAAGRRQLSSAGHVLRIRRDGDGLIGSAVIWEGEPQMHRCVVLADNGSLHLREVGRRLPVETILVEKLLEGCRIHAGRQVCIGSRGRAGGRFRSVPGVRIEYFPRRDPTARISTIEARTANTFKSELIFDRRMEASCGLSGESPGAISGQPTSTVMIESDYLPTLICEIFVRIGS